MAQCELCGTNVTDLIKTKISGAKLNVCPNCTEHGTPIDNNTTSTKEDNNTKYNTQQDNNTNEDKTMHDNYTDSTSYDTESDEDYFEDVSNLALDYGAEIRDARSAMGYSRKELANEINIKQSHLKNIENEKTQPNMELQQKLERVLDIDLAAEDIDY